MPSSKKTNVSHRVVCQCKARECYLGSFIDAYGERQCGVEVLPSTRDAHVLADRRMQALQGISGQDLPSTSTRDQPSEDLVTFLARLHIPSMDSHSPLMASERASTYQPINTNQRITLPRPSPLPFVSGSVEINSPAREPEPTESSSNEDLSGHASDDHEIASSIYDCDQFYIFSLKAINPLLLHVALTSSILVIFDNLSFRTASWLMDVQRITIELSMTLGLLPNQSPGAISASELKIFNRIPKTLATAIDVKNEEQIHQPISTAELLQLLAEHSDPLPPKNYVKDPEDLEDDEDGEEDGPEEISLRGHLRFKMLHITLFYKS
ncbi:uncharacterized protein MELLADRAFT_113224 [Melampsora larici-populina 98AG31]|uniref:Uncharacterized protein n=1 Tax=Melampsora larici-populina (strain 98AG31 / pathotype 3-4-7) TaxID=747676 RepID=F4S962_MELLP|nr:uncharacterized protein MELLADRAFT_113224 [Melampsora larici-populina 98AG31]EGF98762.1 hypothetical protein MELLADRAFT_113224 [Melampsora larici-populina 98AG31]